MDSYRGVRHRAQARDEAKWYGSMRIYAIQASFRPPRTISGIAEEVFGASLTGKSGESSPPRVVRAKRPTTTRSR